MGSRREVGGGGGSKRETAGGAEIWSREYAKGDWGLKG